MSHFKAFANDTNVATIDGLTVENGTDRIALYGSLDLTMDKDGLRRAKALKAIVDGAVEALEKNPSLPDHLPPPDAVVPKTNPFE